MNKLNTLILISATALLSVAPGFASESDNSKQTVAVLGTQSNHAVVTDAALQKAIQTIVKQQQLQKQNGDIQKKIPSNKLDNPIGYNELRNTDKVLILGGAEAMPM